MSSIFLGTSGWAYSWNEGNSLEWYIEHTGFNAIELNMSYYRFPYPTMIVSWVKKGSKLAWIVKVHRSITHFKKLKKESYQNFERFKKLFSPLEESIHYYLLQLPPRFCNIGACEQFIEEFGPEKLALEFRDPTMFSQEMMDWGKKQGILLVSVDAPKLPYKIMSDQIIYERVHGRTGWYQHDYTEQELFEIKKRILDYSPTTVYYFFNNDHMFENARIMNRLLKK